MMEFEELRKRIFALRLKCKENGEPMFMEIPDSWHEKPGPKFRCAEGHVNHFVVRSEVVGDGCPTCNGPVLMTFPNDKTGPLFD
jgi:hypothetical protein